MALYQINISYDGTQYSGYQRQQDQRTIQGTIEHALKKVGWKGDSILSAGRTDAGVHAEEQVAAFQIKWNHSEKELLYAINVHLPQEISVNAILLKENEEFHPRYDAKSRIYRYQGYVNEIRHALKERYQYRIWPSPDIDLMNQAASMLVGTHEFSAFGKPYTKNGRTERIVNDAVWTRNDDEKELTFRIEANSFLYHMVRRTVFILLNVGQRKIDIEDVANALNGVDNLPPGIAPAKGLFLERIIY